MSALPPLPQGDHNVSERITGWRAHHVDAMPVTVELIASLESGPRQTTAPTRGETATSVALQMDATVAVDLFRRIGELAARMGWPLPTTFGNQALGQSHVTTGPHSTPRFTK